ncbi:MAG: hypothetical protein KY447_01120 [Actinobacteria bacterium]|nr:hypothetical protein [Actinomycetota bacterium]MBW3641497.1 hypothetical protein [Actinomycetota bacterium]
MARSVAAALPWGLRALWLVLPFTAGSALAAALDGASVPVRTTTSVGAWLAWALVVLALLVPHPVGLTVLRVVAPAVVAASLWAATSGEAGLGEMTSALVTSSLAAALAFLPETGTWMVNGAAYGDERRHLLRPPAALLAGPVPLAWAGLVASIAAGPLLLAAGKEVAGALALVVGAPVAVVLARALHSLTQRWAVLVPAGLVVKDHLTVLDPVLLRRADIEVLRPAPAGSEALDLTAGATGLPLEARLHEAVPLVRVRPGRHRQGEPGRSAALRFTPSRPGAVLAEARRRRIATG